MPPYFFWGYFWRFGFSKLLNTNLTFRFSADIIAHWCHWCLKSKNFQLEGKKFSPQDPHASNFSLKNLWLWVWALNFIFNASHFTSPHHSVTKVVFRKFESCDLLSFSTKFLFRLQKFVPCFCANYKNMVAPSQFLTLEFLRISRSGSSFLRLKNF